MSLENSKPRQTSFLNICETCELGCCNGVRPPLTSKRKKIIENFLKANNIQVHKPFEKKAYTYPKETRDGYCIFFSKTTKQCLIHPVKPETCVAGPVTFDIDEEKGKIEWFLKTDKVCPLAGALLQNKEILEKHVQTARSEALRLVQNLDSEDLCAILTIEEPDTVKIGEEWLHSKVVSKLKQ